MSPPPLVWGALTAGPHIKREVRAPRLPVGNPSSRQLACNAQRSPGPWVPLPQSLVPRGRWERASEVPLTPFPRLPTLF